MKQMLLLTISSPLFSGFSWEWFILLGAAFILQGVMLLWVLQLRRKQAERIEHEQRTQLKALSDTAAILTSTLDLEQVLRHVIENVEQVVPNDAANIMLVDQDEIFTRIIRSPFYYKMTPNLEESCIGKKIDDYSGTRWMKETGLPLLIDNTMQSDLWVAFPGSLWVLSYLGVPIQIKGKIVGFLQLDSLTIGFFNQTHAARLNAFANQAAIAIENARLFASLQKELEDRKRLEVELVESQKLAGMGTLSAGIAHEINSPLQIITGITSSLLQRMYNDEKISSIEIQEKLQSIGRNGWRVASIVRSLLTYARPSTGALEQQDINVLVKDTLLLSEHQLLSWSNIHIVTELQDNLPPVLCDREKIFQVLINLLTNARDALEEGGEIRIRTRFEPELNYIICDVQDNGPGIPQDLRMRIFDPFFTTKPLGKGTGLGLSISIGIIQAHGGELKVNSKPGEGATFSICLPSQPPENLTHQFNDKPDGRFEE